MNSHNGTEGTFLAEEAFRCFTECTGDTLDWTQVAQDSWLNVAQAAILMCDIPMENETGERQVSAKGLAKALHKAWCDSETSPEVFDQLQARTQLAWEAVGRHLANAIGAESVRDVDMGQSRRLWPGWIDKRCSDLVNS